MIRTSKYADKAAVIELLRESHSAARFPFAFCPDSASALFEYHHKLKNAVILLKEAQGTPVGILMAVVSPHPFGAGLWARETVWFVSDQSRGTGAIKMLRSYEEWAASLGCNAVSMATLTSNDVSPIYERLGYAEAETHFVKYLK
ncbi:GNAT family N-acetyltransferase [Ochrobactrum sp. Sa2BUA5]|nr:GNAT family N-acetyltransferase [Ochrobactrum gallinarum]